MQPEQARFLLDAVYLPTARNEHRVTKTILGAIPPDHCDYRPDGISKTALELGWHIVAAEMRFLGALPAGAFDLSPRPRPESIRNSADLVDWYSENFEAGLSQIAELSNDGLVKIVDFRGLVKQPVVMYLGFMLHHTVHHRGQLSMYLRPMGAKVPAIYGESFDSAEARKAAAQA